VDSAGSGPIELKPAQSRVGKLIVLMVFAAIWNGITWTIMGLAVLPDLLRGDGSAWIPALFLSIFVLIGLVLLGAVGHALLGLGNPRLRLTVNRSALRAGDRLELEWLCSGDPSRVRSLTITLEGYEEATYRRGTDTVTDTHVFARIPVKSFDDPQDLFSGRTSIAITADATPTFIADNNKVRWRLCVHGAIPRWPDISDDYELTILPAVDGR
jgi:hypothetical protein